MSARVAILVEDLYQDQEVWYPYYRLLEANAAVVFVGTGKPEYRGKYGYPLKPHRQIDQVSSGEFDGVIIPGGYAPDILRRFPSVLRFVAQMHRQRKVIGAICHAGWVLCSANVLRGKTVTCFSAIKDDMVNAGATYVDRAVVRDGNLITSRQPDDLPEFMRAILDALQTVRPSATESGPAVHERPGGRPGRRPRELRRTGSADGRRAVG